MIPSRLKMLFALVGSFPCQIVLAEEAVPKHLAVARILVKNLELKDTSYQHGEAKISFAAPFEAHSDCSSFLGSLVKHSYGYTDEQYKAWFGSKRPTARRFHDKIAEQVGFTVIKQIKDVQPGDIVAIKYLTVKENTGHVMVAASHARKIKPREPTIEGTHQWEVKVIDSSMSGHGLSDTRHARGKDGKDHTGLGQGIFRIYANDQDEVVGYSWSTLVKSTIRLPEKEHLLIGRLKPGFKP
jgi:hypothetical protein